MPLKKYSPTSPGRRFFTVQSFEEITETAPLKSLTEPKQERGGRNHEGRVTVRFRGGGHKQRYRIIDFKRPKLEVPGKVAAIALTPCATDRQCSISPCR